MLFPKNLKFIKYHRRHSNRTNFRSINLVWGSYGIKSLSNCYLTAMQIEAIRRSLKKFLPKNSPIWIRVFPDLSITEKPKEVRMGKGVGGHDHWSIFIKKGTILFEYDVNSVEEGYLVFKKVKSKFPGKIKFIYNLTKND